MRRSLILGALINLLLVILTPHGAFASATVTIFDVDESGFPMVRFTMFAESVDANGRPIAINDLTAANINIGEAHESSSVRVTPMSRPVNTVILIDNGAISTTEQGIIAAFLRLYADRVFQPGDEVFVIPINDGNTINVTSANQLQGLTLRYGEQTNAERYVSALNRAHDLLQSRSSITDGYAHILFLSAYVNRPFAYTPPTDIRMSTFQIAGRTGQTDRIRDLSTGWFRQLNDVDAANAIFDIFNLQRAYYSVSYVSQAAATGERPVPVSVSRDNFNASATLRYQYDIVPPRVQFVGSQHDFNVTRQAVLSDVTTEAGEIGYYFPTIADELRMRVEFPDGFSRGIDQATLSVNGQAQTPFVPNINSSGEFTVNFDLTPYRRNANVDLTIEITDAFNLIGRSANQNYAITVVIPEDVSTINLNPCIDAQGNPLSTPGCVVATNTELAMGTIAALGAMIVILLIVMIWQWRRLVGLAQAGVYAASSIFDGGMKAAKHTLIATTSTVFGSRPAQETEFDGTIDNYGTVDDYRYGGYDYGNKGATAVEDSEIWPGPAKGGATEVEATAIDEVTPVPPMPTPNGREIGRLKVLQGWTGKNAILLIDNRTSIGRDIDFGVEVVIERKNISRKHCTIHYDPHERTFSIEDHNSANGTYINGQKLTSYVQHPLEAGDRIQLGRKDTPVVLELQIGNIGEEAQRAKTGQLRLNNNYTIVEEDDDLAGGYDDAAGSRFAADASDSDKTRYMRDDPLNSDHEDTKTNHKGKYDDWMN